MIAKVLAVLFLAIAAKEVASQACHMREVDLCMAIGMFHFQSNGIPGNAEQITEWCETGKEVGDCTGNFTSKCLSPLQREIIGLFSGGGADVQTELCTKGSELNTRYLKYAECLSNGVDTDIFKSHIRNVQAAIEAIFEADFKDRLPTLCCGFRRFQIGIAESAEEMCGKESVEMMKTIMNMIVTDLPDTICRPYDPNSEKCQAVLPPIGTIPKGSESSSQVAKLLDTVFGNL